MLTLSLRDHQRKSLIQAKEAKLIKAIYQIKSWNLRNKDKIDINLIIVKVKVKYKGKKCNLLKDPRINKEINRMCSNVLDSTIAISGSNHPLKILNQLRVKLDWLVLPTI